MQNSEKLKRIPYFVMPALGFIFLLWYVKAAGADVIYSDYIRLINEYLPDVGNLKKMLVPDILTRIPATFLERYINVSVFGYSVTFERILGVCGIGIMAAVLAVYSIKYKIAFKWQAVIYLVLFSLNKWEIILNGTAWSHLAAFACFFINYFLADRLWRGETSAAEELILCLMPVMHLLVAGEYIASYCVTMILVSIFGMITGGINQRSAKRGKIVFRAVLVTVMLALCLYMLSRHFAVWEHSGATGMSFSEAVKQDPLFIVRFLIKSFAGAVIGQETISAFFGQGAALPDTVVAAVGIMIFSAYIFAFIVYIQSELYEETVFPVILLISGFGNHFIVAAGRWIFLKESYALSSRYAGQFMIGIIGMLLIFSLYEKRKRVLKRFDKKTLRTVRAAVICTAVLISAGNCYTTYQEIRKAPYREENYTRMQSAVLNFENIEPEELKKTLEWNKDDETLYRALNILKDNKLNVFGKTAVY